MNFSELGLSPKVLEAVTAAGYTTPTAIQAQAIPHALQRKDVMGLAQTGSGKTAAFVLPMLTMLEKGRARARMPRTLILEPTRELAAQVQEAFETLGKLHNLSVALLIGGVAFEPQALKIDRGADVVIATPGRLLDHFERGRLLLTGIEMLVIDEADRMLDMGFIPDIERICKLLPFTRQTLFFSATMPAEIQRLTNQFLHNPERIEASARSSTVETVEQRFVEVPHDPKLKREALRALIRTQTNVKNAIVFANRKTTVALLEKSLKRHGFNAGALHGDMDQSARLKTLLAFRNNEITYLIASDVAARGLDIPDVSHIFNFDVPIHAEDYVHRIGRTARAGREGHAFTMATREEAKHIKAIESLIKMDIEWFDAGVVVPDTAEAPREKRERSPRRGAKPHEAKVAQRSEANPAEIRAEAPRAEPKPERSHPPRRSHESQPQRDRSSNHGRSLPDAPESRGFHKDNMPAFLSRPVKVG
ncbi:MAG: DEAD/DEAH box helicase [Rhizobiales bacterium]|nr:DEAD/DEAH box helicase [Hyphomicrobiales bacterium]